MVIIEGDSKGDFHTPELIEGRPILRSLLDYKTVELAELPKVKLCTIEGLVPQRANESGQAHFQLLLTIQ